MNLRFLAIILVALVTVATSICLVAVESQFIPPPPKVRWLVEPPPEPYDGKKLKPAYLRCEYRVDPLGIDATQPRLSWQVQSGQRGQRQTAYHVLVATRWELLKMNQGDLWDTGKVMGDETTGLEYGGRALASGQRCYWKVQVWDKDDRPSGWSEPAVWTMGLLRTEDWEASWIGYDQARQTELPEAPLKGAQWIWHAADPKLNAPAEPRLLVSELVLPAGQEVAEAELLAAGDDNFKFVINETLVLQNGPGGWREPRQADVAARLRPGPNSLRVEVGNSSVGPAGLLAKLTVTFRNGETMTHVTDRRWKSLSQPGAYWHNRALDTAEWPAAAELGEYGMQPWGRLRFASLILPPAPLLRSTFEVAQPVKRATLYATALGIADLHLNGRRVSQEYFSPGWTDYARRVYYRTWDVTGFIREGDNAWGAVLADGWFSGYLGFGKRRDHYGAHPRLRAQLVLERADGSTQVIGTGPGWRAALGPLQEADFLMGESYDARREHPGWDRADFDDQDWEPVVTGCEEVEPVLQSHPGPPVVAWAELEPIDITEPEPGVYVVNMGQNFAGVYRLKVSGDPGQVITLRFAERLNPDGTIYTTNLREARVTDTYVCQGRGTEVWEPRFTFHGYQYVEITGLNRAPSRGMFTGIALTSNNPEAGSFECSDPLLNKLHSNILWTQWANFIDLPTDCPQRDERLGWTGDAQVYVRTATLNADVQAFFTKWLVDLADGQRADGQFPMIAPVKVAGDDGGPAWADAGTICPWTIYEVYGDRRLLARHYDGMKRFLEFCKSRSTAELLPPKNYHCFGDWLSIKADTPKDVIYTAYFAYSTLLTSRAARVLGLEEEADRYQELYEQIRQAFQRAYVDADGRVRGDTQTGYVLALAFDLLTEAQADQAAHHLVENIQQRDWHLSTGFIGTKDLMLVLAKIGRHDVASRLIHNDTFPSWGFSIRHGGTSIWEHWDGWTPENGFKDPAMNSFAHYSFGAVYQWMVENLGGIRMGSPAYKTIQIDPAARGSLTFAHTTCQSIRGRIATAWKLNHEQFELQVEIPANTTAQVFLPAAYLDTIQESGRNLDRAEGVTFVRQEGDRAVLDVQSGRYRFTSELP